MKRCSIPLIITEMQSKTTLSYHLSSTRIAKIKKECQVFMRTQNNWNSQTLLVGI